MGSARERLDEQATRELAEEAERHRLELAGMTSRDVERVVTEARRHHDRVGEIMRECAGRTTRLPR